MEIWGKRVLVVVPVYIYNILAVCLSGRPFHPSIHPSKFFVPEEEDERRVEEAPGNKLHKRYAYLSLLCPTHIIILSKRGSTLLFT